ncbi:hypothetical protein BH10CYA1_BH10CYA1_54460 [soil metagenome]
MDFTNALPVFERRNDDWVNSFFVEMIDRSRQFESAAQTKKYQILLKALEPVTHQFLGSEPFSWKDPPQ